MKKSILLIFLSVFFITSCGLIDSIKKFLGVTVKDVTTEAVAVLDRGINELGVASSDWVIHIHHHRGF